MPITFISLQDHHLTSLSLQPAQCHISLFLADDAYRQWLIEQPISYAVLDHHADVIACIGIIEQADKPNFAWALISNQAGKYFLAIHRQIRTFFKNMLSTQIETYVEHHFAAGHRWMRMLGFKPSGICSDIHPCGVDVINYTYQSSIN